MFKLLKLAFYAVIGYAIYELYQGFQEGRFDMEGGGGRGESGDVGQTLTGAGEGMEERSEEPSGMSASHTVGRGVIS
jgi:hypothetical protein